MFGLFQIISMLILLVYRSINFLEDFLVTLVSVHQIIKKMSNKHP